MLFQPIGGYGFSFLFAYTHSDYALIFLRGAVARVRAFVANGLVARKAVTAP